MLNRHKNWLVHKQTACGKDFSNPFMVDNLPKIVGFSTHLASLVKSWLVQDQTVLALASPKANELTIPEQTATGKGTSNPFMAGCRDLFSRDSQHIWMQLYDEIINVVDNHKSEHLEGLHKSRKYVPTYTLGGFVWSFKVWILESFKMSNRCWNKLAEAIPRVYIPRTPIRKPDLLDAYLQKVSDSRKRNKLCRLISTPISNIPRSKISSDKDCIIKELNSRIFKLKAIIQVLGRERNSDVVQKLEFSDDYSGLSIEFCEELNHAFLELVESSFIASVGTQLDDDTEEECHEDKDTKCSVYGFLDEELPSKYYNKLLYNLYVENKSLKQSLRNRDNLEDSKFNSDCNGRTKTFMVMLVLFFSV
ncbi:hypothetical protein Tco_1282625 [Tanacetum coccineum]